MQWRLRGALRILESARGCCGLPGDGSLHALRRWRQREPRAGRQLRVSPRLNARATMHLPASAMQPAPERQITPAQPGGNATGFTHFEYGISAKGLELLRDVV